MKKEEIQIVNSILSVDEFSTKIKEVYEKNSQTILLAGLNMFFRYIKTNDLLKTNIRVRLCNVEQCKKYFKKEIIITNFDKISYFRDCEPLKNLTEFGEQIVNIPGNMVSMNIGSNFNVNKEPKFLYNNFIFLNTVITHDPLPEGVCYELNYVTDVLSNYNKSFDINEYISIDIKL